MNASAPAAGLPVLVVDDDSMLIRTLADILRLHGYAPRTACTGREGLNLAAEQPPALAVVDLRLPDMDGMQVVQRLHDLSSLTEVVVLTGNASVESAIAALREHSVDYLLKPVKIEHLLQVVSIAVERWQRRNAEQALEARVSQQGAVARLGQRALGGAEPATLMAEAVREVGRTLELPFVSIWERRGDEALLLREGTGYAGDDIGSLTMPASDASQAGHTVLRNAPVIASNLAADPRFPGETPLLQRGIVCGITVVVPGSPRPYGVLAAHDRREREFTQDDVHFMQAIAHIVGSAVERWRTEAAFRQAQRLEAVGLLAGGVAHDFNNMLTAIIGYGEMVRRKIPGDDQLRSDVDEILAAAGRASALTRQLLAFSRQQVLQPRVVSLNDVVVGLESMVRSLVGGHVSIVQALDPDLELVRADPGQIEQVLLNLCVNARDAMPNGGRLTIETANVELHADRSNAESATHAGSYVMLAVSDSGIGMDAETKARMFEPFFSTKGPEAGTGLGLSTAYGIVKQSGGEIWVYSELGQGTTFKVYLPRLVDADIPDAVAEAGPAAPGGNETVLLVEDETSVRKFTDRVLRDAGYHVLTAANGPDALRLADEYDGDIHLLVSDIVMPEMSGHEVAERLRRRRAETRVLFLSGYTDATAAERGLLDGGAHFLQKPFATEPLTRKVREALDTP